MAVYTKITKIDLENFLKKYSIGKLQSFEGIIEGIENSNFLIITNKGKFILTIFEKRVNPSDLPFFMNLQKHVSSNGINCPIPISDNTNLNILLKGANTIITTPNGIQKINTLANGGMSKPGMGDVLTGTIGSLASNNSISIENAAIIGVYVHSQSGLLAKEKYGTTSMTASNVISFIPQVFKILE